MIILICAAILAVIFWYLALQADTCSGAETTFGIICGCSLVVFVIGGLTMPINRFQVASQIAEFESVRASLDASRVSGSESERYAILMSVAESNKWLASVQYYNQTIFGDWTPDQVDELKPIE